MIGSYADAKEGDLRRSALKAAQEGDQAEAAKLSAEADQWKEGGAYRASAHAAIGLLAGGVSGALGAAASSALMPDVAEQIKKLGLPTEVESVVSLAAASGIGAAVGGGAGAASAYNVDLNNRQASPPEIQKIKQLADGDSKKEARLQAAACALFRCWQEFAPGTPEYANAKSMGDWGNSEYVAAEYRQLELARSVGLFDYSAPDLVLDVAKLAKNTVVQLAQDFGQLAAQIVTHGPNALPSDLPPSDPWDKSGPSGTAVAVVTPPVVACAPGGPCIVGLTPPVTIPSYVYASTGNASGGSSGTSPNDGANTAGGTVDEAAATSATGKTINVDSKGNALVGDWSATKTLSAPENALAHWTKHSSEFPEFNNASQYVEEAVSFASNPPAGVLTKTKPNGDVMFYDPATNTFAVKTSTNAPRTMFRPTDGINYWNKQ